METRNLAIGLAVISMVLIGAWAVSSYGGWIQYKIMGSCKEGESVYLSKDVSCLCKDGMPQMCTGAIVERGGNRSLGE